MVSADKASHMGEPGAGKAVGGVGAREVGQGMAKGARHLIRRDGMWRYHRRVPRRYTPFDLRGSVSVYLDTRGQVDVPLGHAGHVTVALGTGVLAIAEREKLRVNEALEAAWKLREQAESGDPRAAHEAMAQLAASHGFDYRSAGELLRAWQEDRARIDDLVRRIEIVEKIGLLDTRMRDALLGAAERPAITFRDAAERFVSTQESGWKNQKHRAQWRATIATYAVPVIGEADVAEITTSQVVQVLEPIWRAKPETASRLRQRIEKVLDWARVGGYRDGENPARWRGHLDKVLPAPSKLRRPRHHPALAWAELPAFMVELRRRDGTSLRALELTILTCLRTREVIDATWGEIDFADKVWTIPGERMKAGRTHRVPLAYRALGILSAQRAEASVEPAAPVFPGRLADKPLSDMAMLQALRGMRPGLTVHGFRSSFRDWCAEATSHADIVCEMALAHTIGDKVEAAYRRGELFEKRRKLMQDWEEFCLSAAK